MDPRRLDPRLGRRLFRGSVVSVAIPAIGRDLGLGIAGLQWVMNGYLLTLAALMLLGGALGDRASRSRVFGFSCFPQEQVISPSE